MRFPWLQSRWAAQLKKSYLSSCINRLRMILIEICFLYSLNSSPTTSCSFIGVETKLKSFNSKAWHISSSSLAFLCLQNPLLTKPSGKWKQTKLLGANVLQGTFLLCTHWWHDSHHQILPFGKPSLIWIIKRNDLEDIDYKHEQTMEKDGCTNI